MPGKKIIMVHGLASKPPEKDVHELWSLCIRESLKVDGFSDSIGDDIFRSAYWANAIPSHIEDDQTYVKKLKRCVRKVIQERQDKKNKFHVGLGRKFKSFFTNKAIDVLDIFSTALTIKDNVANAMLKEVRLYNSDQYIADRIRKPLEEELRNAWDEGSDIALLSHSMGTFIAYDVLWRFSHRNVDGYRKYRDKKISLFVTMGSPLGDKTAQDLLFGKGFGEDNPRYYPTNITRWHNYSCLGDIVAHDSTLGDDFHKKMKQLGLIDSGNKVTEDYVKLYNPFKRANGKPNPHKSYGYLVQPKLARWLSEFLKGQL